MSEHTLQVVSIEDEGYITFKVNCPAQEGERCPYVDEYNADEFLGCLMEHEIQQIGHEIVRGKAEGSGPWPVKLTYEEYGEDAEGWIDLL